MLHIPRKQILTTAMSILAIGVSHAAMAQGEPNYSFVFSDGDGFTATGSLFTSINPNPGSNYPGYSTINSSGTVSVYGGAFSPFSALTSADPAKFTVVPPSPSGPPATGTSDTDGAFQYNDQLNTSGVKTSDTALTDSTSGSSATILGDSGHGLLLSDGTAYQLLLYTAQNTGNPLDHGYYYQYALYSGSTAAPTFIGTGAISANSSMTLTHIPEPAFYQSAALSVLGGAGLLRMRLRRRNQKAVAV